jgi:prepilin-type N-terminal cleavage/methylation domain-containing protein
MGKFFNQKNNKGVSLIEMLAAVAIFAITIGAISGLFISAVQTQRKVLATQELLDQTSYVLEYMSRALRMAEKDLDGCCIFFAGDNYRLTFGYDGIRFLNSNTECQEFYLDGNILYEKKSTTNCEADFGSPLPLTSVNLKVNFFKIDYFGISQPPLDYSQPRVVIFLDIESERSVIGSPPKIQIQTSISQRSLDIQY